MVNINLHKGFPFKRDLFNKINTVAINKNEKEIKDWLSKRGLTSEQEVFVSWDSDTAMIVPWKLLIKYFDDFYYSSSDDLTVINQSNTWALLFHHSDIIYWGQNEISLQ